MQLARARVYALLLTLSFGLAPPVAAQRAPDPPPGQLIPYSEIERRFAWVVQDLANRYPSYLARACTSIPPTNPEGKNMEWLIGLARTLHDFDSRWGFNWKRGQQGNPSADVLVYNAGSGPDETTSQYDTNVYGIDFIGDCGAANSPQFVNITSSGSLKWARYLLPEATPVPPTRRVNGDYDGDGRTDFALYRRQNGQWFALGSSSQREPVWGLSTDIPVPGDYDGDGKNDAAVYRPSTGEWWIMQSGLGGWIRTVWGISTDVPIPADYDGDGRTDIAVYRPSTGEWWRVLSSYSAWDRHVWGVATDRPVPADYDGDGRADIAVYRPATGEWWIVRSSIGGWTRQVWGVLTDTPVPGDYDGDARADVAIFRPSTGEWYTMESSSGGWTRILFGGALDVPAPGDYDGDGRVDRGTYRTSQGTWGILLSGGGWIGQSWGGDPSDIIATGVPK